MGQIYAVVGSGVIFIAFCAYFETRDALRSATRPVSLASAKTAGIFAAGVTVAAGFVACYLLGAAEISL